MTPNDVRQALERVKTTDSCGIDEIPMRVIKHVASAFETEIADSTNAIILERKWPVAWKFSEIKPIWKKKG